MPRIVERRPQQIVHRRVGYHEAPSVAVLEVLDPREQQSRVAHKRASRLEEDLQLAVADAPEKLSEVVLQSRWLFVAVTNSKPTAEIDVLQPNPGCPQCVVEFEGFVERRDERLDLGELRTDVEIYAGDLQRGH